MRLLGPEANADRMVGGEEEMEKAAKLYLANLLAPWQCQCRLIHIYTMQSKCHWIQFGPTSSQWMYPSDQKYHLAYNGKGCIEATFANTAKIKRSMWQISSFGRLSLCLYLFCAVVGCRRIYPGGNPWMSVPDGLKSAKRTSQSKIEHTSCSLSYSTKRSMPLSGCSTFSAGHQQ